MNKSVLLVLGWIVAAGLAMGGAVQAQGGGSACAGLAVPCRSAHCTRGGAGSGQRRLQSRHVGDLVDRDGIVCAVAFTGGIAAISGRAAA